jgi:hypothetical protein
LRLRQRLEADQPGAGPAQAGIGGELALVGADIDDGGEAFAPEGDVMLEGGGNALQQRGPAAGALQELEVFLQTWGHRQFLLLAALSGGTYPSGC